MFITNLNGQPQGDAGDGPRVPRTEAAVAAALASPVTVGYRPSLPVHALSLDAAGLGAVPAWQFWGDVEGMRRSPHVRDCLNVYMGGIWPAKFKAKASAPEVAEFVADQLKRFWTRSLRGVQDAAYSYGWAGGEVVCAEERGRLCLDEVLTFHPRDVRVLTRRDRFAGVRVTSARPMGGAEDGNAPVDLWAAGPGRPGKAFWYTHNARFSQWYGESQLLGAWRPWRRLEYPDGATEVIDQGFYRFAFCGPIVKYPKGSDLAERRPPGEARQDFRDKAREMAEGVKAGASIAIPSTRDDHGQPMWEVIFPDRTLNLNGLLEYHKQLVDEVSFGIGVPPEIRQASDVGSGYSGRHVSKEVFFLGQQHHAAAFIKACRVCWLDGLVAWNFGPDAWYEVEAEPLLASQEQQAQGRPVPAGPGTPPGSQDSGGGLDLAALLGGGAKEEPKPEAQGQQQLAAPAVAGVVEVPAPEHADAVAEEVRAAATRAALALSERARREVQAAVRGKHPALWADAVLEVLRKHGPAFARLLRDARVAAALAGARRLARRAAPDAPAPQAGWMAPPPEVPWGLPALPGEGGVSLPVIEEAARDLAGRGAFTRPHFDALEEEERRRAFTVAGLESDAAVAKVRDLLSSAVATGGSEKEFAAQLDEALAGGPLLSPARLETVFRTNVLGAYSNGLDAVLRVPGVGDAFPYAAYHATHDDRTRPNHLALESLGIGGTNVYRTDDPVWQKFRPPWDYCDRCTWSPLTIEQAAAKGVAEAREWLRTGQPPAVPSWVPHPPFDLPEGWQRLALGEAGGDELALPPHDAGQWRPDPPAPAEFAAPPPEPPPARLAAPRAEGVQEMAAAVEVLREAAGRLAEAAARPAVVHLSLPAPPPPPAPAARRVRVHKDDLGFTREIEVTTEVPDGVQPPRPGDGPAGAAGPAADAAAVPG